MFGRVKTLLVMAVLALGIASCDEAPLDGDCEKLLHHLVDLEVNASDAADAKKKKLREDLTAELKNGKFISNCEDKLKEKQVTCSLKAKTTKEVAACDGA